MAGRVATVKVFDAIGREHVCLANNQLLGNGTQWKWDGTNSRGQLLPNGIYIIWIRCFDTQGSVFEEKKVCVVGSRQR
jgi:flagellar hook assembly protein FlgD